MSNGVCTLPVSNVLNDVVVAVVCNTDYIYEGEQTRLAKFDYRLEIGDGILGTADIYTKWWDYNPETYTIAALAGGNGTISPSGAVVVNNGAVQSFTFAPAPGYQVDEVLLNGITVGSPSSYTLNPVLSSSDLHVTFRDAVAPDSPTALAASAVNGGNNLTWAENNEPDLDGYRVYRANSSWGPYVPIAYSVAGNSYFDDAIIDGETYYYVVSAVDVEANESAQSTEASAVSIDTLAPIAPTGLTAEVAGTTAVLSWDANTEADLASYTIYRSTTSGSNFVSVASNVTGTEFTDVSLTFGEGYYYVVTATDASANESAFSSEVAPDSALLAYWDFDDAALGAFDGGALPDSDGYSVWRTAAVDKSGNGNDLTTWNYANSGFNWSIVSEAGDFSIKSAGANPSAFTWSTRHAPTGVDIEQFVGATFTVEAVSTITGSGYRTVVGRDAQNLSNFDAGFSALWLGLDDLDRARFYYTDIDGNHVELRSEATFPDSGTTFHHFAVTSDGSTVSLFVDGVLVAEAAGANMSGLGIGTTSGSNFHAGGWSVGRSLFWGGHADRWHGYIDSVAISSLSLEPGSFVLSDLVPPALALPSTPTGLTAIGNDGTVDLDWSDSGDIDFKYYAVYRSTTSGVDYLPIRVGLTSSEYTDPSADNGTAYYYAVTAYNHDLNESEFSDYATATPLDVTPPSAPAALSAFPGNGAVSLYWNDSADSDFYSYTVYRSTSSGAGYVELASGLTTSAYVDNSVDNNTRYFYVVAAVDTSDLESAFSNEVTVIANLSVLTSGDVIGSSGAFGGSGNTIDTVFDGNLETYYDAVNASGDWVGLDLGSAQSITMIKYCPRLGYSSRMIGGTFQGSNTPDFSSGVETLFTISASPTGGELNEQVIDGSGSYRYVRYIGPDNTFCNVAELEFYTLDLSEPDTIPPATPHGLTATVYGSSISLNWASNSEPDLASYTVYRSTMSGSGFSVIISGLATSEFNDSSVANDVTYYYMVSAKDVASNESALSDEVAVTNVDVFPPLAPSGLTATVDNGAVQLNWSDNREHDFASYSVYRSLSSESGYEILAAGLVSSEFIDHGVEPATTYYYAISAADSLGNESTFGNVQSVMTPVEGGVVTFSSSVPAVADGVQNLNFSSSDVDNTQHHYVPSDYIGTQYRGDALQMAQSFTTGTAAGAYFLTSVSVRQAAWGHRIGTTMVE